MQLSYVRLNWYTCKRINIHKFDLFACIWYWSCCVLIFVFFCLVKKCFVTVIPHREHLVPPPQPTISAAQLGRTVPTSQEGCPPATPSTSGSREVHETSRVLRTTEPPPPLPSPTATANKDDRRLPAFSASSLLSLCAGERERKFNTSVDWHAMLKNRKKRRRIWNTGVNTRSLILAGICGVRMSVMNVGYFWLWRMEALGGDEKQENETC